MQGVKKRWALVTEDAAEELDLWSEAKAFNVLLPPVPGSDWDEFPGQNYNFVDGSFSAVPCTPTAFVKRLERADAERKKYNKTVKTKAGTRVRKEKLRGPLRQKLEVNLSPVEMMLFAKIISDWKVDFESPEAVHDYLKQHIGDLAGHLAAALNMRTGLDVLNVAVHMNSGKWHFVFWVARVDKDLNLLGEKLGKNNTHQLGRCSQWQAAVHSSVLAGYELPSRVAGKYLTNRNKKTKDGELRYPEWDNLDIQSWLYEAARTWVYDRVVTTDKRKDFYAKAQADYCSWLTKMEPVKQRLLIARENRKLGNKLKEEEIGIGDAYSTGQVRLLTEALRRIVGEEGLVKLEAAHPIISIVRLVDKGKVFLETILDFARLGVDKLIRFLSAFRSGGAPKMPEVVLTLPAEELPTPAKVAPEPVAAILNVPVVLPEPDEAAEPDGAPLGKDVFSDPHREKKDAALRALWDKEIVALRGNLRDRVDEFTADQIRTVAGLIAGGGVEEVDGRRTELTRVMRKTKNPAGFLNEVHQAQPSYQMPALPPL